MTVPMALVDYIPVVLFLVAAIVLQRSLYDEMGKGAFAVFSAGTITVFVAGLFKATWKLLYAAGICDFEALNQCFFPMQTTGFVLAGLGALTLLRRAKAAEEAAKAAAAEAAAAATDWQPAAAADWQPATATEPGIVTEADLFMDDEPAADDDGQASPLLAAAGTPAVFKGTMVFVGFMVAGVAAMDFSLAKLAKSRGKGAAMVIFIASFVFTLGMGYLSSKDFADPAMNWVAEGVNICGQLLFLVASIMLSLKPKEA